MDAGVLNSDKEQALLPFESVEREVRLRVASGRYAEGKKLPPERELVEEFEVSRLTVAKALAPLVAEGLIERQRGRGSFVTENARALSNGDRPSGHVGTRLVSYISIKRAGESLAVRGGIVEGMHQVLDAADYRVAVDFYADHKQYMRCLARADNPESSGFVLWPETDQTSCPRVEALVQRGFPLVLVDAYLAGLDTDYVVSNNVGGAAGMVGHLVELGHRNIVYLTEATVRSSLRDRMSGFLSGMIEHGICSASGSVVQVSARSGASVVAAVDAILARSARPTAILTSNDMLAMSVYRALAQRGLSVPSDISLAGFDDVDAAQHFAVPLTTMKQDFHEMGEMAGQILLERMKDRPVNVRYQRRITPKLVVRDSTAAAPQ